MKTIEYPEFKKILMDYKLGLLEGDIKTIFASFDVNHAGSVDYEEFLRIVRVKRG